VRGWGGEISARAGVGLGWPLILRWMRAGREKGARPCRVTPLSLRRCVGVLGGVGIDQFTDTLRLLGRIATDSVARPHFLEREAREDAPHLGLIID
jgi:hypothetical protein